MEQLTVRANGAGFHVARTGAGRRCRCRLARILAHL